LLADFALSEDSELIGRETTPVELTSNVVHGSFNRINMILWHLAARTLSGLFVATVAVAGSQAQGTVADATSKGTPIKSEVQLVLLDVVVTSGNGRPVGGLRKDDFQVAEDGHPQTISFFEEHTGTAPIIVSLPPMPPNVFTNYPTVKKTDSINVFLLDALNTQNLDQAFVRAQMTNYLREAAASPNGARFAIFTLGSRLRMIRGFTADSSTLLAAMSDPASGTEPKVMKELSTPARIAIEDLMISSQRSPVGQAAIKEFLEEERGEQGRDRAWMTLQAFQQLARYLAKFPGRKNVLWLSGSFPINFFPASDKKATRLNRFENDVRQTTELLIADQVAVYPILATGLTIYPERDPSNMGSPINEGQAGFAANQIAMETLAQDTGGKAFYNGNALDDAMARVVDEGSHYYTLAYTPSNAKRDGKYRRVELKTTAGAYKLAYRRGYYAENTNFAHAEDQRKNDNLIPLMAFGMPDFDQILYKVQLVRTTLEPNTPVIGSNTELKAPRIRCGVDFAISPQDLRWETGADGVRRGNIEVMLVAYDRDGKLLNSIRKKSEIVLDQRAYTDVMRVGLQMDREIDVPEGQVLLRTGIYDLNSGKAGTLGAWTGAQK
jgi:VWFA-related protein